MNRYNCGGRYCTDPELDQLEKIRSGTLEVVEPGAGGVSAGVSEKLNDLCTQFPNLCQKVESTSAKVEEMYQERHSHPKPGADLVEALVGCKDCNPETRDYLLPELAKRFGYTLIAPEKPAEGEPETKAEGEPETKPEPVPAPPEGEPETPPEGEPEGKKESAVDFLTRDKKED